MARKRVIPNVLFGSLGLAVVGTAAYFAIRALRSRRVQGKDEMLALRRSSRKAGRVVKDVVQELEPNTASPYNRI